MSRGFPALRADIGTPPGCYRFLADRGEADLAYQLLTQQTYPSWGDQIRLGATTVWDWNSWQPPNQFQDPSMNAFNHFSLATVGQFLYQQVAGINPDPKAPGYQHTHFRPHPHELLGSVAAALDTPHGVVCSSWSIDGAHCEVTSPHPEQQRSACPMAPVQGSDEGTGGRM